MNHDKQLKSDEQKLARIEIYWQDLTKAKQDEILQVFGDNGNWDVLPIAILGVPAKDSNSLKNNYAETDYESRSIHSQPERS